jgi:hypothetical protein
MQREMQNRENNPRNPNQPNQPERRRDDRRHQEQQPNEERRRQERRENNPTTGQMSGQGGRETRGADEKQNFGESYDRGVGQRREHHEGAGKKTDGTQRDIGRTGKDK